MILGRLRRVPRLGRHPGCGLVMGRCSPVDAAFADSGGAVVCGSIVVVVSVRFGVLARRWAALVVAVVGLGLVAPGPVGAAAQPATLSESPAYADVPEDAYYYDAVSVLAADGVFEGTDCGDGQFCPGDPLKRWQMAVWLIRALGETDLEPATQTRFGDVSDDDWWAPHVERMADLGITVGCSSWLPPKYCPDNNVNRGQMASFLTRALDLPPAEPAGFTDVNADNVHRGNINRLAAAGITLGCKSEPRQFCPHSSVTKAQMSAFIYRALEVARGESAGRNFYHGSYTSVDLKRHRRVLDDRERVESPCQNQCHRRLQ